ncbi:pilus assembly FimT family protein [Deferribacter desulfuricans]|nr:prepilin-type N-terminal cleavage/methylation domain-containing protein [Deferribacter desulfuricans]
MDRKIMNKKGITLIELLVVISIFAIILAIAIPNYNKWKIKHEREKDLRQLYSIIQQYRTKAFTEKTSFKLEFPSQNKLDIKNDNGTIISSITFKVSFDNPNTITIDDRGTLSNTSIKLISDSINDSLPFNCIVSNGIRVRLGKIDNGGSCVAK